MNDGFYLVQWRAVLGRTPFAENIVMVIPPCLMVKLMVKPTCLMGWHMLHMFMENETCMISSHNYIIYRNT